MDSATMHIASLLGITVVSVWGATHPFAGFYGYGQHPDNAVQADLPCRPCSVFGDRPLHIRRLQMLIFDTSSGNSGQGGQSGRRTEKRQTVTPPTNSTTHSSGRFPAIAADTITSSCAEKGADCLRKPSFHHHRYRDGAVRYHLSPVPTTVPAGLVLHGRA